MKINNFRKMLAVLAVAGLGWSASNAMAQDASANNAVAPQLSYGVPQILKLAKANVGDETIIAYIKNSGNSYGLNADQIIYLRQQGISDAVVRTMLNQPKPAVAAATATPAPQPEASTVSTAETSTAMVAPEVTYVQTVPATTYYYYQPYYYPDYAWYPPVTFSFGWGGGFHGGGFGGGFRGGGFGGGFHGGGFHGGGHR